MSCSFSGHEQRRVVLSNIQGLASCVGLPAPDSRLDVLCFAECNLSDVLTVIRLRAVLKSEQAEYESRLAEVHPLEEHLHPADVH